MEHPAFHAADAPERLAVLTPADGRSLTYRQLENRSTQVANLLWETGLRPGDHVAILVRNRVEYFESVWGAMRSGLYVTPINWHLTPEEAAYIVRDCEASVVVAESAFGDVLDRLRDGSDDRLRLGLVLGDTAGDDTAGAGDGFERYDDLVSAQPTTALGEQCEGNWMLYSSGTTGRPKGIRPPATGGPLGGSTGFGALMGGLYGFGTDSVYLNPAPLYHAAPAGWTTTCQRLGGSAVVMDRFDPLETLRLIEAHRITHVQFVPTHLVRLLKLSDEERQRYDLSSLQVLVHAAAPCPAEVKEAMLDWVGPIVHEYYSGSEGAGFCAIGPDEWVAHRGSVGRSLLGTAHVLDERGHELPPGEVGQLWFDSGQTFEYHGDPDRTAEAVNDRGWATFGDMGRLDDEGYVYLTDRVSSMIISGGVNIYPREVEDILTLHPQVTDIAVIGIPDDEMGESVRAVVQPAPDATADDALGDELIAFCRERLSHFKCPTSVVFVDELPRLPTGKLAKRLLPDSVRTP